MTARVKENVLPRLDQHAVTLLDSCQLGGDGNIAHERVSVGEIKENLRGVKKCCRDGRNMSGSASSPARTSIVAPAEGQGRV